MGSERRPESDTPRMETRSFTANDGRRWSGSVMSGRFAGGEDHAEVFFVCEDVPSEVKRATRQDSPPVEAADEWRSMDEPALLDVFRRSEPA